ncbi:MAG: hypothetical protein ACFFCU_20340 [Promethearchaeota archaeon]
MENKSNFTNPSSIRYVIIGIILWAALLSFLFSFSSFNLLNESINERGYTTVNGTDIIKAVETILWSIWSVCLIILSVLFFPHKGSE